MMSIFFFFFSCLLKELSTGSNTWSVIHYTSSLLMQLHFPSNQVCRSQAHSVCLSCARPCWQHVRVHKYLQCLCEYLKVSYEFSYAGVQNTESSLGKIKEWRLKIRHHISWILFFKEMLFKVLMGYFLLLFQHVVSVVEENWRHSKAKDIES